MKLPVVVKPNSKKGPLIEKNDGCWIIYVQQPAIDGQANAAIVRLIAKELKIPKTRIKLIRGAKSKTKLFEIPFAE